MSLLILVMVYVCLMPICNKSVENLNIIQITMEKYLERERKRERERERDGKGCRLRFFTWFGYVSLHPQNVADELHIY